MIFLDTTVLVHAVGGEHPYRRPSLQVLDAVQSGLLQGTTTPEVIQEFTHVRARRHPRGRVGALAHHYIELLAPLRLATEDHLREALTIWRTHQQIGSFDAVLAAVALDSKYTTLVSVDGGFASIEGLHHVFPDEDGVASLLDR